ncbi:RNA polymerase sigma-70 factor, ECF subfamily [Mucilaginibacter lappiensis]|uniref:RNA polymerase sigma-70 factor (ECF subfamily) n=1 Tax=Mucilaginibacter lappiensis TaxID=354630 RepID=A0ABR6PG24_9SPHI|nr:sigma-70 family RNA polymerase sigma factor [Mucilaginibacter lappiensis]MBB6108708.1 RNA polymerase sigma-70 factor (ECF subfamily) [Mucilaginibacter lappiensis]SIQ27017.1 RNA polymerase sigma-70 factor, ECF subfamily [Mucilaginibacter lappiensis]
MVTNNLNIVFLLKQLQLGSEQAFAKIYDHFSRPLYRNILYLVKEEEVAQEILQELFLHVWTQRARVDAEKTFWPYLYKVARWLVLKHFRKVAQDKRLIEHLIITTVDHVTNAEDMLIDQEMHALLAKAIENLPPQRKQVFKLCKFDGKSYQEASEILGISTETIRNQIVAANRSVKEYFRLNNDLAILLITPGVACLLTHNITLLA